MPDPSWPTPPRGWTFWVVDRPATADMGEAEPPRFGTPPRTTAATYGVYGTDRGSWLAGLRARASSHALVAGSSPGTAAEAPTPVGADSLVGARRSPDIRGQAGHLTWT